MDVDTLRPGVDFRRVIEDRIASSDAMVVLIGRDWVNTTDPSGTRRLDNPRDFVRLEIGAALRRPSVLVIPVLVRGAAMPAPQDLPPDLEDLAWRNALELSDTRLRSDLEFLVRTVEGARPHPRDQGPDRPQHEPHSHDNRQPPTNPAKRRLVATATAAGTIVALATAATLAATHPWTHSASEVSPPRAAAPPWRVVIRTPGLTPVFVALTTRRRAYVLAETGDFYHRKSYVLTFSASGMKLASNRVPANAFSIASDRAGNVYAVSVTGLAKLDPNGTLAPGWSKAIQSSSANCPFAGIAVGANGDIYVSDTRSNMLIRVSPDGRLRKRYKYAHPLLVRISSSGGSGRTTTNFEPCYTLPGPGNQQLGTSDLAADGSGHLLVADRQGISEVSEAGQELQRWQASWASIRTAGAQAPLYQAQADTAGNLYLHGFAGIEERSASGLPLAQFTSKGSRPGEFTDYRTTAIAVSSTGTIYVVDAAHQRIQEYRPAK
jgi:streptogramin lyase